MRKLKTFVLCSLAVSVSLVGCDDSPTETKGYTLPQGTYAELLYPEGGETFQTGDTVNISYVVDRNNISHVIIEININNGEVSRTINEQQRSVAEGERYQKLSEQWIVGEEHEYVEYEQDNGKCFLSIHQYNQKSMTEQKFEGKAFSIQK